MIRNSFSVSEKGKCFTLLFLSMKIISGTLVLSLMMPLRAKRCVVSAPANITTNDRWSNITAKRLYNRCWMI